MGNLKGKQSVLLVLTKINITVELKCSQERKIQWRKQLL